jgi:3'-phosphoadenosine 5'-phosphosulfate sulfotransferase (PAPS reductase)/FAD synthetase
MRAYLQGLEDEPVNAVGVRAGESIARAKLPEREYSDFYDCEIWRPIHSWSEQDVIDAHTRHGVRPNSNYLIGARRVGCWPCIYAAKKEIHLIADTDPDRIDILRDLERTISSLAGDKRRGWFVNKEDKPDPISGKRDGHPWPIDKVVQWSRTKRGGRQFELFLPPDRERGCMRWGLCDTGSAL